MSSLGFMQQIVRFKRFLLNRRGHGVHSPFVFDLISRVIEERMPYYVFDRFWQEVKGDKHRVLHRRELELCFRLVCHYRLQSAVLIGNCLSRSSVERYLVAAFSGIEILYEFLPSPSLPQLVVILDDEYDKLPVLSDGSLLVLKCKNRLWPLLQESTNYPVAIDLVHLGVAVSSQSLNKKNYKAFL